MEVQHIHSEEAVPREMAKNGGWIMKMVNGLEQKKEGRGGHGGVRNILIFCRMCVRMSVW